MRKPTHAFAAFIWTAALITFALQLTTWVQLTAGAPGVVLSPPVPTYWYSLWRYFYQTVWLFVQFGTAAVLVELVDTLRWLATPEQDRPALAATYLASRWRRSRVS